MEPQPTFWKPQLQEPVEGLYFDTESKRQYRKAKALWGTLTTTNDGVYTEVNAGAKVTVLFGGIALGKVGSGLIIKIGGRGIIGSGCVASILNGGSGWGENYAFVTVYAHGKLVAAPGCIVHAMAGSEVWARPGALVCQPDGPGTAKVYQI